MDGRILKSIDHRCGEAVPTVTIALSEYDELHEDKQILQAILYHLLSTAGRGELHDKVLADFLENKYGDELERAREANKRRKTT